MAPQKKSATTDQSAEARIKSNLDLVGTRVCMIETECVICVPLVLSFSSYTRRHSGDLMSSVILQGWCFTTFVRTKNVRN